jgi:hypothetical protein
MLCLRYRYTHIKPALRALSVSQKVSIRTDDSQLLCLQFMAKTEDGHVCFIEYYVSWCYFHIKKGIKHPSPLFQQQKY